MKPTFFLSLLTAAMAFTACTETKETSAAPDMLTLNGTAKGISDSSWIYLDIENELVDSALVLEERFVLSTPLEKSPAKSVLRTKDFSDYVFLWVENTAMEINAEKGKFKEAMITGSVAQEEAERMNAAILPIRKMQDSLQALRAKQDLTETEKEALRQQFMELREAQMEEEIRQVRANPYAWNSAYVLDVYKSTWGKEQVSELFNNFSEELRESAYGKSIAEFIALNKNPQIGDQMADFTQENPDGKQLKLSDYQGKVVLLEFWASWCGPCRQENPELVKTYNSYKDKGFEIFAVSLDNSRENWLKAIEKDGLSWPNVSELNGDKNKAALIYGVSGIPDNYLIDRDGTIIAKNLRGEKLKERLGEIFK